MFLPAKNQLIIACISSTIATGALATISNEHIIAAPSCLLKPVTIQKDVLASNTSYQLIKTNDAGINALIKTRQANKACGGFMDVSAAWTSNTSASQLLHDVTATPHALAAAKYEIKHQQKVAALLKTLNSQNIWDNLTTLTNFNDRYANSENGINAAAWVKQDIEALAAQYQRKDISVYYIDTKSYSQPSVIVKIGNSSDPGVVISAHIDTLNSRLSKKPGADDDGSGSATVLETARNLIASNMTFKKPVYFMWYAAEEEGLVGSNRVVHEFKAKNIPVAAVLHFDMTGYEYKNLPDMWLMKDYVDSSLVSFLEQLITTYVKRPVHYSRCGYACSDHASWTQNGYAAGIAAEAAYENTNSAMHSSNDTMDKLSLEHMTDYAKLASAFAVELAEPLDD